MYVCMAYIFMYFQYMFINETRMHMNDPLKHRMAEKRLRGKKGK